MRIGSDLGTVLGYNSAFVASTKLKPNRIVTGSQSSRFVQCMFNIWIHGILSSYAWRGKTRKKKERKMMNKIEIFVFIDSVKRLAELVE